jgi:putative copper resistance protein D
MLTELLILARAAHIAAAILITGTLTFNVLMLGLAGSFVSAHLHEFERRLFRVIVWSLFTALVSAFFWFYLEAANMSGLPLAKAFAAGTWRIVLFQTEFGRVWQLRLSLIAVMVALMAAGVPRTEGPRPRMFILWLLSVAFLVSLAWISHAAAAPVQPLGLVGDALHLSAAGGWIGGLVPLAIFLTCARTPFSSDQRAALVLRRFSTFSLCCVSLLIISGVSNSWLLVGSIYALFTTAYGRLLLFKLALFGILVNFGAQNRLAIKKKSPGPHADSELMMQVRRNVIYEACLGGAVVAIVACLGVTPPSAASMMDKHQASYRTFRASTTR